MLQTETETIRASINAYISGRVAAFDLIYRAAPKIEFDRRWNQLTGYMDGIVTGQHAPVLAAGEVVASCTSEHGRRKLVVVGTPLGNVVVFQRYQDRDDIFAYNSTRHLRRHMMTPLLPSLLDAKDIELLLGTAEKPNIGQVIATACATSRPTERDLLWRRAVSSYSAQSELD